MGELMKWEDIYKEERNEKIKYFFIGFIVCLIACAVVVGIFWFRGGRGSAGSLDTRYSEEYGRAAETIRGLETELERERGINRQLREHNSRAREIALGIAGTAEQNVGNLQEAVGLIRKIRTGIKVLADVYVDSSPDSVRTGSMGGE